MVSRLYNEHIFDVICRDLGTHFQKDTFEDPGPFWGNLRNSEFLKEIHRNHDIYSAFHLLSHKINIEKLLNFIKMNPTYQQSQLYAHLFTMSTHSFFVSHSQWKEVKYGDFTTEGI